MLEVTQARKASILFVWLAISLALITVVAGYGLDVVLPMAHDIFHDARHAAGFACH